jgi:hypothetical protein
MSFDRNKLPDAQDYYENTAELTLVGRGTWKTARCDFHGGSDSTRINTKSGAFVCMAGCGARGGDVLAYHMAVHGLSFIDAAKSLGCWLDDGKEQTRQKPSPIPARAMLEVVAHEVVIASLVAADLASGRAVSDTDRNRLLVAAGRIGRVAQEVRHVS